MIVCEIKTKDISPSHTQTGSGNSKVLNAWHFVSVALYEHRFFGQSESWVQLINAVMKIRIKGYY
jgi:hypothetical protein